MDPFVHLTIIKEIIDTKVKNLQPDLEKLIIDEVILTELKSKYKILQFIRKRLNLPKVGSDKYIYWKSRGWSESEIKKRRCVKKMPSSPMIIDNWLNKINEKTGKLYTVEEAKYKIKSFRKLNKEYWMERGYNESESIEMVSEYQKENSNKFVNKIIENPENYKGRTWNQLEYWVKNGYSENDSKLIISDKQDKSSLNYLNSKYGKDLANEIYNQSIERKKYERTPDFYMEKGYTKSESLNIIKYQNKKRVVKFGKSSKESLSVIIPIYNFCIDLGINDDDIYFGYEGKREFFISDIDNFFMYDFTIKELKIIIEYNGVKFHPNPNWKEDLKLNWKCVYSGMSYTEKYNFDKYKNNIAILNGFKVFTIFSDENKDEFIDKMKFEILNEYEKNRR